MPDVFITLEEAAAFEGITYEAMKKRVQRSPKQHNVKSQAREGGGKDQVLISTSSLSAKARKAWRAAQKVEGSEVIIDKRAQEAVPWYVTADLNQYTEANKKRFYEAVELAARVQDFIDYDNILVKSSVTVSQNISVTVTTDTADTDEAVENRVKAILTELLAVRRSRKLNELTLSDINHAIRSGYSGATNAAVSEPEADVKLGKDKVITLGDVSVTVERE